MGNRSSHNYEPAKSISSSAASTPRPEVIPVLSEAEKSRMKSEASRLILEKKHHAYEYRAVKREIDYGAEHGKREATICGYSYDQPRGNGTIDHYVYNSNYRLSEETKTKLIADGYELFEKFGREYVKW